MQDEANLDIRAKQEIRAIQVPRPDFGSRRHLYLAAGYVFFALGVIGILVPLMPGTVFWIVAAACFARSSERMYCKIMDSRLGPAIEDYLTQRAISPKAKMNSVIGMGAGLAITGLVVGATSLPFLIAFAVIGLACAYIVTRPVPVRAQAL